LFSHCILSFVWTYFMLKKPKRKPLRYHFSITIKPQVVSNTSIPKPSASYLSRNAMQMITFKIYGKTP